MGQFAPTTVEDTQFNLRKRWRKVQELVRLFGVDGFKSGFQVSVHGRNGIGSVEIYKLARRYWSFLRTQNEETGLSGKK